MIWMAPTEPIWIKHQQLYCPVQHGKQFENPTQTDHSKCEEYESSALSCYACIPGDGYLYTI